MTRFVTIKPASTSTTMQHFAAAEIAELVRGTGKQVEGVMDLLNDPLDSPADFFVIGEFGGYTDGGDFIVKPMCPETFPAFLAARGL